MFDYMFSIEEVDELVGAIKKTGACEHCYTDLEGQCYKIFSAKQRYLCNSCGRSVVIRSTKGHSLLKLNYKQPTGHINIQQLEW